MQPWCFLVGAIALEVAGTTAMKLSEGFTKLGPSVLLVVCYAASFAALTLALKQIEVSVAYAAWAGIGTALIAAIGMLYFRETVSPLKLVSLGFISVGVVGLHLSSAKP
jgi:small multidrug resistance pump